MPRGPPGGHGTDRSRASSRGADDSAGHGMYPYLISRFCGDAGASISQRPGAAGMSRLPRDLIISVDGPVAAGKTTAARLLARRLGYCHIESGAMYRALAWKGQAGNRSIGPGGPRESPV